MAALNRYQAEMVVRQLFEDLGKTLQHPLTLRDFAHPSCIDTLSVFLPL